MDPTPIRRRQLWAYRWFINTKSVCLLSVGEGGTAKAVPPFFILLRFDELLMDLRDCGKAPFQLLVLLISLLADPLN